MKSRQVLLINPKMCKPRAVRLPLSLLALGAALEGKYEYRIIDGNVDPSAVQSALAALKESPCALAAITVMPGPQVATAIEISTALRAAQPGLPIAWGGYFPTLYPDSAINAAYVDYVVRGQGEETILELLARLPDHDRLSEVEGLTWKKNDAVVHNRNRSFHSPNLFARLPYHRLPDINPYLRPSFMGTRTAVHQAAIGCRYHCSFCGVVSMFNGHTQLQAAENIETALTTLRGQYGANAIQFYDHNFFDSEASSLPAIEVLARLQMPWWCYARADTLAKFSAGTWKLLQQSRFTMAYIGAESASAEALKRMRKGSRVEHTLEVAAKCLEYGVIPEFSFVLGGPEDPEGEIENTFSFVKRIKQIHPRCEVILYFYSPTPQRSRASSQPMENVQLPVLNQYGPSGPDLPITPEEWTQPEWINYVCHLDAPWLSPKIRQRVKDFAKVLQCRFPTVQDYSTPAWGKSLLKGLATWRYHTGRYTNPWELDVARKFIPLRKPQEESI